MWSERIFFYLKWFSVVQLPWMFMVNLNLLHKHAKSFRYATNLNETWYNALFFLTTKIYERIYLRKAKNIQGQLSFFIAKKCMEIKEAQPQHQAKICTFKSNVLSVLLFLCESWKITTTISHML